MEFLALSTLRLRLRKSTRERGDASELVAVTDSTSRAQTGRKPGEFGERIALTLPASLSRVLIMEKKEKKKKNVGGSVVGSIFRRNSMRSIRASAWFLGGSRGR